MCWLQVCLDPGAQAVALGLYRHHSSAEDMVESRTDKDLCLCGAHVQCD